MRASLPVPPDLHFWSERELGGACLLRARYGAHEFTRHVHDEMVVTVTEDGAGEVHTRQARDVGGPGTVWVFAPGEYHEGKVRDRHWAYRGLYLDAGALSALAEVFGDDAQNGVLVPPRLYGDPQLARMILAAHARLEEGAPLMERETLWWSAMGVLFGRYGRPPPNHVRAGSETAKMRVALDYMAANHERNIGNRKLASLVGLSPYHFVRSFRRAFGMPPHAYLNQMRLVVAKRLLREGRSPGEAAVAVGFFDQSHLNRMFKRAYGITPGVFAASVRDRRGARALDRGSGPHEVSP
jgi:AraC-like DNA-binding protein